MPGGVPGASTNKTAELAARASHSPRAGGMKLTSMCSLRAGMFTSTLGRNVGLAKVHLTIHSVGFRAQKQREGHIVRRLRDMAYLSPPHSPELLVLSAAYSSQQERQTSPVKVAKDTAVYTKVFV